MISAKALNAALRNYFADIVRPDSDLSKTAPVIQQLPTTELSQPEAPPVVVPSLTDRIRELSLVLGETTPIFNPAKEPENLVVVDYYNRSSEGTEYLGKLYIDPTTGRDYKFVTHTGKVIPCYLGKDFTA